MEDKFNFLKDVLLNLRGHDIEYSAFPNAGGCSGYGVMEPMYNLNSRQVITLLEDKVKIPELFQGLPKETISEADIEDTAFEACFPDYSIDIWNLPYDLEEVAELFGYNVEEDPAMVEEDYANLDDDECYDFTRRFNAIIDDEYYFSYEASYEEHEVTVFLEAEQARGLIIHYLKDEKSPEEELVLPEGLESWVPFSFKQVGKIVAEEEGRPSIRHNWDEAVDNDKYIQNLVDIINEYLADRITENEVQERIEDLK